MVDDRYPVADFFRNIEHMGRKEDRVTCGDMLAHHFLEFESSLGIESCHRLIEDPDGRLVQERPMMINFWRMPWEKLWIRSPSAADKPSRSASWLIRWRRTAGSTS